MMLNKEEAGKKKNIRKKKHLSKVCLYFNQMTILRKLDSN